MFRKPAGIKLRNHEKSSRANGKLFQKRSGRECVKKLFKPVLYCRKMMRQLQIGLLRIDLNATKRNYIITFRS